MLTYHQDAIIVAVDGACRNNGRPFARAGAGVYFHRANWRWNKAVVLEDEYNTSQRAELFACSLALRLVKTLRGGNPVGRHRLRVCAGPSRRLRRVVIKADSEYLVKAMTDWINKWRTNGYENCRGLPVTNADMFKHLDHTINELNAMDVQVEFWHVRREENREADCLANAALDGIEPQDALDEFFND
jgi:ribonuclease HI